MELRPEQIIRQLGLEPLPGEGGMFRQSYIADEGIPHAALPDRYPADKPMCTAIYYLLTDAADSFSALHRLPTDEIFHFYAGDPVEMLLLHPDGRGQRVRLGSDFMNGEHVQFVVRRDVWQGSRLAGGGRWALLGTTMSPGFTPSDYTAGLRAELLARYPEFASSIRRLTRD
jgi:uncharacterized protein